MVRKTEGHFLQRFLGAGMARFLRHAFDHQAVSNIVEDRHMGKQRIVLEHGIDVPLQGGSSLAG